MVRDQAADINAAQDVHAGLLDASNFVRTLVQRQGLQVGSVDEIAFRAGWIDCDQLADRAEVFRKNGYGALLGKLLY